MATIYRKLYKKGQNDPDNHDAVVSHLQPDIMECEVKWALRRITTNKASGRDGIPAELFLILKDDAVKVLHSKCQQIFKNSAVATRLEKASFHSSPQKGQCQRMFKLPHKLISHASKVMLKILKARLWHYVNQEHPDVQAGFRKGRGTWDRIANIHWIIQKVREFKEIVCFTDYGKAFDCVDNNKLWKILQEMGTPDHLTCLLRNLYAGQEATV